MDKGHYKALLYSEISDLRCRRLSLRVSSVLNMIENRVEEKLVYDQFKGKTAIPVLKGNDFGMVFQSILFLPEDSKWVVVSREGKGEIYFEALVDVLWYLRSLHLPLQDAIYDRPF